MRVLKKEFNNEIDKKRYINNLCMILECNETDIINYFSF